MIDVMNIINVWESPEILTDKMLTLSKFSPVLFLISCPQLFIMLDSLYNCPGAAVSCFCGLFLVLQASFRGSFLIVLLLIQMLTTEPVKAVKAAPMPVPPSPVWETGSFKFVASAGPILRYQRHWRSDAVHGRFLSPISLSLSLSLYFFSRSDTCLLSK